MGHLADQRLGRDRTRRVGLQIERAGGHTSTRCPGCGFTRSGAKALPLLISIVAGLLPMTLPNDAYCQRLLLSLCRLYLQVTTRDGNYWQPTPRVVRICW